MRMKRKANMTAAFACILWGGVFLLGRALIYHIYDQGPGIFPTTGQMDHGVVLPMMVVVLVGGCAWIANAFQRWFTALAVISVIALMALLPFVLASGGGV